MPDRCVVTDRHGMKTVLSALTQSLGGFTASNEQEFIEIGHILARAIESFGRMEQDFTALAAQLHHDGAGSAAGALEQAARGLSAISLDGLNEVIAMLSRLEGGAAEVGKRLELLKRIVTEVRALAINGKIQASLVASSGMDFSVFTTEIGRLGQMADDAITQLANRMDAVRANVASALRAAMTFEREDARELDVIRERIESGLAVINDRRRSVAGAADSVATRTRQISQRIAATVGELQINDNVNQRIEHVRSALREVIGWSADDLAAGARLASIPEERRLTVIAGICRLCAAQLEGGAADYGREIGGLIGNLNALATDAADILADANAALEGGSGSLFVSEIEADIRRVTHLLSGFHQGRQHTHAVIKAVAESIEAMSSDLATIRSIDADMRVMGLNATLKCGRLGDAGRALGVVSHELRVCSKRTEDCTVDISGLLDGILDVSRRINAHSEVAGGDGESGLGTIMDGAVSALSGMGTSLSEALGMLRGECGVISSDLSRAAAGVDIHRRLDVLTREAVGHLTGLGDGMSSDLGAEGHQDILGLIYPSYTMVRERQVHQSFAAGLVEVDLAESAPSEQGVDDLFF